MSNDFDESRLAPNISILRTPQQTMAKDLRELAAALEADTTGTQCAIAVWMQPQGKSAAILCKGFKDSNDAARRLSTVFDAALGFAK